MNALSSIAQNIELLSKEKNIDITVITSALEDAVVITVMSMFFSLLSSSIFCAIELSAFIVLVRCSQLSCSQFNLAVNCEPIAENYLKVQFRHSLG